MVNYIINYVSECVLADLRVIIKAINVGIKHKRHASVPKYKQLINEIATPK